METMGINRTQAKKKIAQYRYVHGLTKKTEKTEEKSMPKEIDASIESKLEELMKEQEKHKEAMDRYMALYCKEQVEYNKIKYKTDVLCSAMDILNNVGGETKDELHNSDVKE